MRILIQRLKINPLLFVEVLGMKVRNLLINLKVTF